MSTETQAKPATAQEKYEARWAEFARTEGVEFATPEAKSGYREHVRMFKDVVELKKPKRVPVCPSVGFYPFAYAGVTAEEAMYDYGKLAVALKKFHADFLPDSLAVAPIYGCGKALDILDYKLYRWPGRGVPSTAPYQCVEAEYMHADEYDAFIADPSGYFQRFYLPRIFGALDAWKMTAPPTDVQELPFFGPYIVPMGIPPVQQAYQKLLEAGRVAMEWIHAAGAADAATITTLGIPAIYGGFTKAPFDTLAVMHGDVSPPGERDRHFLSDHELASGQRLACQTHALDDVKVHVPKESLVTGQRLQLEGISGVVQIDPAVRTHAVTMPAPSLHDPRSDLERVTEAVGTVDGPEPWTAEPAVVRALSPLARSTGWRLTAYTRGRELVGVAPPGQRALGFACDLGTTKVAGYLVDLETGANLATAGVMNPQIGYGEDVISRLARASQDADGARQLARVIREALDSLVGSLTASAGAARDQVVECCIVGNTAMTHLLLELPVQQLAVAPFVAAASAALDVRARDVGLNVAPGAYVHVLPCVRGFVGADHVAMILASDLDTKPGVAVGVDIGTNTEIVIARPDRVTLTAASCASGPAFEGAHISHGMRAAAGAIEALRIEASGVNVKTIGGAPPVGLCGSGIVDAIAEMHRTGAINDRGRLVPTHPGVRRTDQGLAFVIVPVEASGTGREILVTQRDIGEIQLAKSAVHAGMESLIEAAETRREDIAEVIIAGAFGSYLNLDSALAIGLLPRFPKARYVQVGNAAGAGAKVALLSLSQRRRASAIAGRMGYVELTTFSGFSRRFAAGMAFPELAAHEVA